MKIDINEVYWHDGNLNDTSFQINEKGESQFLINGNFYQNEQSTHRDNYIIYCTGVEKINLNLDTISLKENMRAGNISNGYLRSNTLWLYLSDGLIEITAKKFEITKK